MIQIRLSRLARNDLIGILKYSKERFGLEAADAYESLILRAFRLIQAEPGTPTIKPVEGRPRLMKLHLRLIPKSTTNKVARPRHIVVFETVDQGVRIVRILHEKMNSEQHLR